MAELTLRTRTKRAFAIIYLSDPPKVVGYTDDESKARKRAAHRQYRWAAVRDGKVTIDYDTNS